MKSHSFDLDGEIIRFERAGTQYKLLKILNKNEKQAYISVEQAEKLQQLHKKRDFQEFGHLVRNCRERLGMTQEAFAKQSRLSRKTISYLENGKAKRASTFEKVMSKLESYKRENSL